MWNHAGAVVGGLLSGLTEYSDITPFGRPSSDPNYRVGVFGPLGGNDPYYEKGFGSEGFKQEFYERGGNQVRHFIAYFAAGSRLGQTLARIALRDQEPNYNASNPDVALGWAAIEAGRKLKDSNYRDVAQIVWHEICGGSGDLTLP